MNNQLHFYYIEDIEKREILPFSYIINQGQFNSYKQDLKMLQSIRKNDLYYLDGMAGRMNENAFEQDNIVDYYSKETRGEFIKKSTMRSEFMNKKIASELFVMDSFVIILDFENGNLNKFSFEGVFIDSLSFQFHKEKGWSKAIQQYQEGFVTSYENENGIAKLQFLNKDISLIDRQFQFISKPVTKWKVRDNFVYYLVKPDPNLSNSYFMMEPIK